MHHKEVNSYNRSDSQALILTTAACLDIPIQVCLNCWIHELTIVARLLQRKAALASALDDDVAMTSADDNAMQDVAMAEAAPELATVSAVPEQAPESAAPEQAVISAEPEQATNSAEPEQATAPARPEQGAAESSAGALVVREEEGDDETVKDWASVLVNSQYETVLLAMLEGLRWEDLVTRFPIHASLGVICALNPTPGNLECKP